MSNSDILLHQNQLEAVATNGAGLVVTTAEGADPDATLRPKWASLTLGGGDGSNSDGDIKLRDRDGNTRVHFDGKGNGPADPDTTQVFVDGRGGKIELGKGPSLNDSPGDAMGELEIWGNYSGGDHGQADIRLKGRSPAGDARIKLTTEDNAEGVEIEPEHINMNDGSLSRVSHIDAAEGSITRADTLTLEAGAALSPPGDDTWSYEPGEITVLGDAGDDEDQVETVEIHGQPPNDLGGAITLRDDRELTNVEIRAGNASIRLGGTWGGQVAEGGPDGRPGKIFLDDTSSNLFRIQAENEVVSISDFVAGDTLFEIDVGDQVIRTKYSIDEESL